MSGAPWPSWIWTLSADWSRSREGLVAPERPWSIARPTVLSRGHAPWRGRTTFDVEPGAPPQWGAAWFARCVSGETINVPHHRPTAPGDLRIVRYDAVLDLTLVTWSGLDVRDWPGVARTLLGSVFTAASAPGPRRLYLVDHVAAVVGAAGAVGVRTTPSDPAAPAAGESPAPTLPAPWISAVAETDAAETYPHGPGRTGPYAVAWREVPYEGALDPGLPGGAFGPGFGPGFE